MWSLKTSVKKNGILTCRAKAPFYSALGVIMYTDIRLILSGFGQFFFLALLVTLPVLTIGYDLIYLDNGLSESSMTEILQASVLFLSASSFYFIAYKEPSTRHFCVLVAGFFTCMLIREFDEYLDVIVHGFWVYPALFVAVSCIAFSSRNLKQTIHTFAHFTQSRHFVSLCLGMALLLVFSRLFGMGEFWKGIMGPEYIRIVKLTAEESLEMLGYIVIFYGVVGYLQSFLSWCKYRITGESYAEFIGKRNQFFAERASKVE